MVQRQPLTCALADDGSGGRAHSRAGVRGSEGTEAPEELLEGHPDQGGVVEHRPGEAEWFGHSSALSSTLAGGGWGGVGGADRQRALMSASPSLSAARAGSVQEPHYLSIVESGVTIPIAAEVWIFSHRRTDTPTHRGAAPPAICQRAGS